MPRGALTYRRRGAPFTAVPMLSLYPRGRSASGSPSRARRLEQVLFGVALLCGSLCTWSWLDARLYQGREGHRLDDLLRGIGVRSLPSRETAAATRAEMKATGLIGRLEIPRLGLVTVVAEGTDAVALRRAVGHVPGTALPGERGNVALAGHRDSYFRHLKDVKPGDRLRIITLDGTFEYRVDSRRVVGSHQTEVLAGSSDPTLTLITCFPFDYVGPAPDRFIVTALPVP